MSVKLEQMAIAGVISVVIISAFLSYGNNSTTGQFSLEGINKQVKEAQREAQRAVQVAQEKVVQQYPACCADNRDLITLLSRDVEALKNTRQTQAAAGGGGGTSCCNQNLAEIMRLTREVDTLRNEMVSLQRHVQDLEIAESRAAQSSDEPTCSNVGAIANQMNCQQACQVSNRRCTRAELVRMRLSDNARMPPIADACSAALHQNDATYSYSFSCRCCP